jgi:hypothetical protein
MSAAGRPREHPAELLALAYELNQSGVTWDRIHRHLGQGLRYAINRAKRFGIKNI